LSTVFRISADVAICPGLATGGAAAPRYRKISCKIIS
jgi:hypothetical protein